MNKKKQGVVLLALVAAFVACLFAPCVASAAEAKSMYRLYNQWTGEHLYTADANERKQLVAVGWIAEGDAWDAPAKSSTPVWRLYNPYVPGGDHHYTKDKAEYDALKKAGWRQEGLAWYSDDARGEALFRLYNPYAQTGTHHYTVDTHERNELAKLGWNYEGIAWYGVSSGPEYDYTLKSGVKSYSNYDWLGASSYVVRQTSSAPKVGDKIVIDPTDENPFGAAGTITSVSRRSDGSYSVSIRQATDPSEVFTDIEAKQAPVEADRDKAVVSGASGASGGGVDLSGDWEPEGDAFGASFDVDLGSGSYAKGGFSIKPTIGYDIKWTIFGGLERCELSVGGKVDLDVETHVQNKNAGKDIKVFEASVPIAYGFSVDLPLYVHISAEGDLTLAVDYEMDTTMSLVNGKWVPFDHSDFDAELSAAVHLRLGGKVGAELKWLQVQLVDAAVGAGADGTAKTTIRSAGLTCADLSAYMYLDVEIGKGTDYLKKLGWTLDKEILNASNSPLKLALHFENGNRVPECTWGKEDDKPSEPTNPDKPGQTEQPGKPGTLSSREVTEVVPVPTFQSGPAESDVVENHTWGYLKLSGGATNDVIDSLNKAFKNSYDQAKRETLAWRPGSSSGWQCISYRSFLTCNRDGYIGTLIQKATTNWAGHVPFLRIEPKVYSLSTGEEADPWEAIGLSKARLDSLSIDAIVKYVKANPPDYPYSSESAIRLDAQQVVSNATYLLVDEGVAIYIPTYNMGYSFASGPKAVVAWAFDNSALVGNDVLPSYAVDIDS